MHKQGGGRLATWSKGQWELCCLAVACEVAIANGVQLRVSTTRGGARYNGQVATLPGSVVSLMGFFSPAGDFDLDRCRSEAERREVNKRTGKNYSLTDLNDSGKWSFKRIAAFCRKYPHLVFKGPR